MGTIAGSAGPSAAPLGFSNTLAHLHLSLKLFKFDTSREPDRTVFATHIRALETFVQSNVYRTSAGSRRGDGQQEGQIRKACAPGENRVVVLLYDCGVLCGVVMAKKMTKTNKEGVPMWEMCVLGILPDYRRTGLAIKIWDEVAGSRSNARGPNSCAKSRCIWSVRCHHSCAFTSSPEETISTSCYPSVCETAAPSGSAWAPGAYRLRM